MCEFNLLQVVGNGTEVAKKISRDGTMVAVVYQWGDEFYAVNLHKAGDELEVGDWGRMPIDSISEAIDYVNDIR